MDLLEDTRVVTRPAEPGDHDLFAHYVDKKKWGEALMTGDPVVALCGKVWYPTKDAARFKTCPDCLKVWEMLP